MNGFDAETVRESMRGVFGRTIDHRPTVDSTNTAALALARSGASEGTVVIADEQTAGRGRGSNRWESPAELGLYWSLLLRPSGSLAAMPLFGVLGGVAAVQAVRNVAGVAAELKWPNDVLVGGRKVGGVLADATNLPDGETAVVVGVGLNVGHADSELPTDTPVEAASLRGVGANEVTREALAIRLIAECERHYSTLAERGPTELQREVTSVWADRGRWVTLEGPQAPDIRGRTTGIDLSTGVMLFEDQNGMPFTVPLTRFVRLRRL